MVTVTLDAYLEGALFDSLNARNFPKTKAGRDVDMVSRHSGIVRSLIGTESIKALSSFRSIKWEVKVGDFIPLTIDCFTRPGCVQLVHESEEQADADLDALHGMEDLHLIDYSVMCSVPPTVGAIVIVDPFSTGAHLAAMVVNWGYKLILVFSERDAVESRLISVS